MIYHEIEVIMPTVKGMNAEGNRNRGFLDTLVWNECASRWHTKNLEYNCPFRWHITQPIHECVLRSDLAQNVFAAINGKLARVRSRLDPRATLRRLFLAQLRFYPLTTQKADVHHSYDAH